MPTPNSPIPRMCTDCVRQLAMRGFTDPTEDVHLLHYLHHHVFLEPSTLEQRHRVQQLAAIYSIRTDHTQGGAQQLMVDLGGRARVVPGVGERQAII